jgi:NADP-dependent 3-hydroxy acid dehydrogenase YdfG
MVLHLHDAVVAVTGAGRGIGKATARVLAEAGAKVALGDLEGDLARTAAAEIGTGAIGLSLDVSSRASFAAFLDAVRQALGPVEVLVNNAGVMHVGRFLEEEDAFARSQIEVNLYGTLVGMKLVLPGMVERGRGAVVNIASVAGKTGFPGGATYVATKHAVVGLTESVRAELRGTGVRVCTVLPSVVRTELAAGLHQAAIAPVAPEDVARAVRLAIRTGHAQVYVPRGLGLLQAVLAPLPLALRSALAARLGADRVLAAASPQARAGYEARARRSAPKHP